MYKTVTYELIDNRFPYAQLCADEKLDMLARYDPQTKVTTRLVVAPDGYSAADWQYHDVYLKTKAASGWCYCSLVIVTNPHTDLLPLAVNVNREAQFEKADLEQVKHDFRLGARLRWTVDLGNAQGIHMPSALCE